MNIAAMSAVNLGQFEPKIQIAGPFLDFLFQNFDGGAEITLGRSSSMDSGGAATFPARAAPGSIPRLNGAQIRHGG